MNAFYRPIAALLCAGLLLCLMGCTSQVPETQPTENTDPTVPAEQRYDTARAELLAAPNQIIQYDRTLTRLLGTTQFSEKSSGTASFSGIGTDAMDALVQETLSYGTLRAEHTLTYCQDAAYSQISGCTFTQAMTAPEFLAVQLPGALLDRALYGSFTEEIAQGGRIFTFSEAAALESWVNAAPEAQLTEAFGTATLDTGGSLIASTYTATYILGETTYRLEVSIRVSAPEMLDLSAVHPEHLENAVSLAFLDAPKLLMRAVGDIFTAQNLNCTISETVYSEAIPLSRDRETTVALAGSGKDLTASLLNTIQVTDFKGQPVTYSQGYQFAEGLCTSTADGGEPTVEAGITAETMRTDLEDTILAGLFATKYLASAVLTEDGSDYVLTFSGNDSYCNDLSADIGSFLNMDLDGLAASFTTTENAGYLRIHKETGLPTGMGMSFARTHVFGEVPHALTYKLDQNLQLS